MRRFTATHFLRERERERERERGCPPERSRTRRAYDHVSRRLGEEGGAAEKPKRTPTVSVTGHNRFGEVVPALVLPHGMSKVNLVMTSTPWD